MGGSRIGPLGSDLEAQAPISSSPPPFLRGRASVGERGGDSQRGSSGSGDCAPGYSGCLDADAYDYDCAGGTGDGPRYTGTVSVSGSDPFGLDDDGDGTGCE
jgi:hypothetical protein